MKDAQLTEFLDGLTTDELLAYEVIAKQRLVLFENMQDEHKVGKIKSLIFKIDYERAKRLDDVLEMMDD